MTQEKLLLIPGPSPVHPRIIHSLSLPTVSHVSPVLAGEFKAALENLKRAVFCAHGEPFIIAGAGTLSMEIAVVNVLAPGERALVLSQGYFGDRMSQVCGSFGFECDVLAAEWGKAVLAEELEAKIKERPYSVVFATHVDTATGACAPVEDYARVLRGRESLFVVDGVCATAGIEERMDDWGIDIVLTAAQKCFGAPPGLSLLVFSERAMGKRQGLKKVPAYYADILRWLPIMKDPTKYFSTPCVNEIRAFYESTKIVMEEGLENRFQRHALFARAIRSALSRLGFTFFTLEPFLAATLSVAKYPEGVEDKPFREILDKNGVVVAGGLGSSAGHVFRMGHMGNISAAQVTFALDALERTLKSLGYKFDEGAGVRTAKAVLEGQD